MTAPDLAALIERLKRTPQDWQNPEQALLDAAAAALAELQAEVARLTQENGNLAQQYQKAIHVRDVFASAVVMQAAQEVDKMANPQGSSVDKSTKLQEPDPNGVICPNCVHQFRAIPENVQAELAVAKARIAELERELSIAHKWQDESRIYDAWHEAASRIAELERERDAARAALLKLWELWNDPKWAKWNADYKRGHLSYANVLDEAERPIRAAIDAAIAKGK